MQRRKFMIGVGSLAAGGAAATGTGAFSQMEAERGVNVAVVNDADSLLAFDVNDGELENNEYASYENGELKIHINDEALLNGNGGQGLNPNATYDFDNVFALKTKGKDDVKINIDKSNLDHPDDITLYASYPEPNESIIGDRNFDWSGQNNAGHKVHIGLRIETPDWTNENWETGSIVIEAWDPDDDNTPA